MRDSQLALDHLLLRLKCLNRSLRALVTLQAERAARLTRPDVTSVCVTDEQVACLLNDVDRLTETEVAWLVPESVSEEEREVETVYRQTAEHTGELLPLDQLSAELQLSHMELEALLVCTAPEVDPAYERIFAYVQDDLDQRFPSVEMLCRLTAQSSREAMLLRSSLGRFGRLRRARILVPTSESIGDARTTLRLGPGVLEFLLGSSNADTAAWRDADEICGDGAPTPWIGIEQMARLAHCLLDSPVGVVGIWGPLISGAQDAALSLARMLGLRLRQLPLLDRSEAAEQPTNKHASSFNVQEAIQIAAAQHAVMLVSTDLLQDQALRSDVDRIVQQLAASSTPVILTGTRPWRPTELLASRRYCDLEVPIPSAPLRRQLWADIFPDLPQERVNELSLRFHLSPTELRAVSNVADARDRSLKGRIVPNADSRTRSIEDACNTVLRKTTGRFTTTMKPTRGPQQLILPDELSNQILELAEFTKALPRLAQDWGFTTSTNGGLGHKALFTGDPGTGKTLSAEVIASILCVPLMTVDISQTVSKWVGETEKNLEEIFNHAASSHAVLFFDEADALFGRRGDVRTGVDRYANTEVSYLLQRIERHVGLIILASNLRDNIDPAFMRRFNTVLHFPRPNASERLRMWKIAFPAEAPVAEVDWEVLAALDLTGAGIFGAARTAALMAAAKPPIEMVHIIRAAARQYQRESRILSPSELGRYASLLKSQGGK